MMAILVRYKRSALPCIFVSAIITCSFTIVIIGRYMPNIEAMHPPESNELLTHISRMSISNISGDPKSLHERIRAPTNYSTTKEMKRLLKEVKTLNEELVKLHYDLDLLKLEKANDEIIAQLNRASKIPDISVQSDYNQDSYRKSDNLASAKDDISGEIKDFYGTRLNNEFEVVPFTRFTLQRLYLVDPGLGKRVVEKPIGYKRAEITEVVQNALNYLNSGKLHDADSKVFKTTEVNRINKHPDFSLNEFQFNKHKDDSVKSLNAANKNISRKNIKQRTLFVIDDFLEGMYRNIPTVGTLYELYFRGENEIAYENSFKRYDQQSINGKYLKVVIRRPYNHKLNIVSEFIPSRRKTIEIILALSGRIEAFRRFMNRFAQVCIVADGNIGLTVVYFGTEWLSDIQSIMHDIQIKFSYTRMRLVRANGPFSRGRGLQLGAEHLHSSNRINDDDDDDDVSNKLLFLCDVDVIFTNDFLERCRLNTERGRKVYYPIVFSLYNPDIVDSLKDDVESSIALPAKLKDPDFERITLSRETGFWRDFGYGMTCQYRNDFLRFVDGLVERSSHSSTPPVGSAFGWGMEDVALYRRQVQSGLFIVRSTDPGIFHAWHTKLCDANLSEVQYRSCIRSKALNEASHAQLGMLAFRHELMAHRKSASTESR